MAIASDTSTQPSITTPNSSFHSDYLLIDRFPIANMAFSLVITIHPMS